MNHYHQDGTLPDYPAIFVFGSNLAGRHGAGAARIARQHFDAQYGTGQGITGRAYAIPTKDAQIHTLPLQTIQWQIGIFLQYAQAQPAWRFFVTRIGCGLAGYKDAHIAPLFQSAPENCSFADTWRPFLEKHA